MVDEKYIKRAERIVNKEAESFLKMISIYNNTLTLEENIFKLSLTFYSDHDIKFIKAGGDFMFPSVDVWFDKDIEIGVSRGFTNSDIDWDGLIDTMATGLYRREEVKKVKEYYVMLVDMPVKTFLINEFVENIITAQAELEEYGFSKIVDFYKIFFRKGNEIREAFLKELKL